MAQWAVILLFSDSKKDAISIFHEIFLRCAFLVINALSKQNYMDDDTNFLSVKKGQIISILTFSLLFKANCEECVPPPPKKSRVDETRPSIIKYAGSTPKQVQPSVQTTLQSGQKLKSKWTTAFYGLPAPTTQSPPPMVQQVSPGPSGIQILPSDFANVSIFFLPII